jgi:hypothetical protein
MKREKPVTKRAGKNVKTADTGLRPREYDALRAVAALEVPRLKKALIKVLGQEAYNMVRTELQTEFYRLRKRLEK